MGIKEIVKTSRSHLFLMKMGFFVSVLVFVTPYSLCDITYTLNLGSSAEEQQVAASVAEAAAFMNQHGSFNKHWDVYYWSGTPTAESNYSGYMKYGGSRNVRVVFHEGAHTFGMGTASAYSNLISTGVWAGYYGNQAQFETYNSFSEGLNGDGHAIWPGGFNYNDEDGYIQRFWYLRIMAGIRADMGILSFTRETENELVHPGETAQFKVESPSASSYLWYKDGVALSNGGDISGATGPMLQIANAEAADEGSYYCAATGAGETLNCRPRELWVTPMQQLGQWDFDGNVTDSVNTNSGTAYGSPAYVTGKIGQAINLDGINDYVTLPASVGMAKDITIAAWVNWDGGGDWQRIFDFGTGTYQTIFLSPKSSYGTMRLGFKDQINATSVYPSVDVTALPIGQWVHVAVVLNGEYATLYVNGQPVGSVAVPQTDPIDILPTQNYIGKSQYGNNPLFNGRVDDFGIYNYALHGSEVWDLWGQSTDNAPTFDSESITLSDATESIPYTGQTLADYASDLDSDPLTFTKVSGPAWLNVAANGILSGTPGDSNVGQNTFIVRTTDPSGASDDAVVNIYVSGQIKAYYQFEGNLNDSIGTNHATATGTPVYTTGYSGQAIDLDGTNDYVTLPSGIIDIENCTIAAWVNWDGGNQWQRIFDFGNDTSQNMFLTPSSRDNTLRFGIRNGGGEQIIETSQLTVGQWVHVAVTLSGDTGKLYVDGQLEDTNYALTINPDDFNPAINYIGKSQWPDPLLNGRIDDFRIYHYAMSDAQIGTLTSPPLFTSNPITNFDGIEFESYAGQSLSAFIENEQDAGSLTFSKSSGPEWLNVAPDGTLSGFPRSLDTGQNSFTVQVENQVGLFDTTQMTIQVSNTYSGVLGLDDLAGLSAQWLMTDCVDIPACGGADLSGDSNVDMFDLQILSQNWLADESLQLHLKFDEPSGTIAQDRSVYTRSGQLINGPVWASGYMGGALDFDGVDDYVEISGFKGIAGGTSRTCMAWIKTTHPTGEILSWGEDYSGGRWVIRVNEGGQLRTEVKGGNIIGTTLINDGNWHHVAVVLEDDGSPDINEVKLYVDGNLETISASADEPVNSGTYQNVQIGMYYSGERYFKGMIDEVRIYNRVLTAPEIAALASIDLKLHLTMDKTTGTICPDISIYNQTGHLKNMDDNDWVPGHLNNALEFDGIDDYLEMTDFKGIPGGASRTCMAWIKTTHPTGEILSWGEDYSGGRWVIRVNEGGQLRTEVKGGNIIGTTLINDGNWHHVAVVLEDDGSPDINEVKLYVDGNLETISASADEPVNSGTYQNVQIGMYYIAERYFKGMIDDVSIYDRALTETEIQGMN